MKKTAVDHAHKHDHCKHDRLKFCAQCNKPHCLECGQEWNQYGWNQPVYTYFTDVRNGQSAYSTGTILNKSLASLGASTLATATATATSGESFKHN